VQDRRLLLGRLSRLLARHEVLDLERLAPLLRIAVRVRDQAGDQGRPSVLAPPLVAQPVAERRELARRQSPEGLGREV
jgi:hypothetical protein